MEKFLEVFYGKESVDDLLELLFNSTDDYDYIFEYFMYNLYHEYLNSVYASHYSLIYKEINKIKNTIIKDLLILNVDDSFIDLYILFLFKQLNK